MLPVSSHEQTFSESPAANDKDDNNAHLSTPPIRPTPSTTGLSRKSSTTSNMSAARRKISPNQDTSEEDQDYLRFVQSLGEDDPMMAATLQSLLVDEDEEEFVLTDLEDDDDDEDDELMEEAPSSPTARTSTAPPGSPLFMEHDFYSELEAELGSLLEEDLEAAVSTLLAGTNNTNKKSSPKTTAAPTTPMKKPTTTSTSSSPATPLGEAAAARQAQMVVTPTQVQRLQKLMTSHYQLLVQSAVLSVRAARKEFPAESPLVFHCGETPEELTEILDGAVGMLQDMDQNRKDAIRNYIQRMETTPQAQRSLLPLLKGSTTKRLTRSAFHSLQESTNAQTIFDVDGLYSLKQTFQTIDHCGTKREGLDILDPIQHADACRVLLDQAGAKIDEKLLPGKGDLSQVLCDAREVFGKDFKPPASIPQQIQLRKNRNQFTAAEDNLVLRGVNLYGEKQWILIADRFLPDRSVNIISQRYSKLCLLVYKAHGVKIDEQGNLETPPRFEKVDELDEEAISKIKRASPPAILNVHRWSLEEDVTLLKAVPLLGNQWAELSTRLVPHRDRGHLRKRYQVLERRVKATVARTKRGDVPVMRTVATLPKSPYKPPRPQVSRQQASRQPRKRKAEPVKPTTPAVGKPTSHVSVVRGPMPAHLLRPTDGPKHPGAKVDRKMMEFQGRRPFSHEEESDRSTSNGSHAHANGRGYAHSADEMNNGGYEYTNGHADSGGYGYGNFRTNSEFDVSHEASRFEKILSETTDDWSQLSRMKKMMENDTESMVASTIVNNLANRLRDPPPPPQNGQDVAGLPDMEAEATSGLSMLYDSTNNLRASESGKGPATPPKAQNGSILASVLERTRTSTGETQDVLPSQESGRDMGAPSSSFPLTPSGPPPRHLAASFGTPLGASPGPGLQMRTFFSPGGHKNVQSPGLKSWGSPGPMHSLMGCVDSNHEYELYPFELTEASRQALESESADAPGKPMETTEPAVPSNPDLFDIDVTHGLKSTDLEAISALNSLSNSPAKFLKKRGLSDVSNDETSGASKSSNLSLFATVVGGVEQKESKRKKSRNN